jgi:hypothetical protein
MANITNFRKFALIFSRKKLKKHFAVFKNNNQIPFDISFQFLRNFQIFFLIIFSVH